MIDSPLLLLAVLAVLAAVPLLLRRHKAAQPDGLRVMSRTALSRSSVLAVVAVGERRLLVGAGEHGVHLIADVTGAEDGAAADDPARTTTASDTDAFHLPLLGRMDVAGRTATGALTPDVRSSDPADAGVAAAPTAGPGIGLVDRLRAMTVRTPPQGRPFHVPLRR